jgi:hypothetical protein
VGEGGRSKVRGVPVPVGHAGDGPAGDTFKVLFGRGGWDISGRLRRKTAMDKVNYIAQRAVALLSAVAAFAFVINGAKRW